jgi:hypothetical protein
MAWYKNTVDLHPIAHEVFDGMLMPGVLAPYAGIYKCQVADMKSFHTSIWLCQQSRTGSTRCSVQLCGA